MLNLEGCDLGVLLLADDDMAEVGILARELSLLVVGLGQVLGPNDERASIVAAVLHVVATRLLSLVLLGLFFRVDAGARPTAPARHAQIYRFHSLSLGRLVLFSLFGLVWFLLVRLNI